MASKLAELLFKDYRRRALGLLLLHADKRYHVREIARRNIADATIMSVSTENRFDAAC